MICFQCSSWILILYPTHQGLSTVEQHMAYHEETVYIPGAICSKGDYVELR